MAALVLIVTGLIVTLFYCLDALYGERRDRSLLFWKSMPASDRTTVLAKAAIPFVVIPAIVFALVMAVQLLMLLITSVVLLAHGMSPASTLGAWNPAARVVILAYGLFALVLWHAPIYAWLIFVSAWARRAVLLWAIVPLIAFSALFRVGWSSEEICSLLIYRAIGGMSEAFIFTRGSAVSSLSQLTPGKFFGAPGLWVGLALAAVLLAAAVRVRRNREPI
jgi:ABC-2 type transport system permease protein